MTLVLGVLILVSVIAFAHRGSDDDDPVTAAAGMIELRSGQWYATATLALSSVDVERVIDGDTLDVLALSTSLRVRAFGFDSPEQGERCAEPATARLTTLTADGVQLLADERVQDRFGRELRYLFTAAGLSIDAVMVDEGLAHAWREDGAFRDLLVAIEDGARSARRGCLWADG
jgi:endonuclease YncB( thermonuclease family)